MPDKEQSPSVTELEIGEAICWLRLLATRFEDEWPTTANAARHHAARIEALHAEREKLTSDAEVQAKTAIAIGDALEDQGVELSPPQMIYVAGIALEAAIAALNASPKDSPDAP
jgi:hypothetical protein